jgi:hypothetical protein
MNTIGDIITCLHDSFNYLNKELDSKLPDPYFTLIPNRGKTAYLGWFFRGKWKEGKSNKNEINICPDTLKRPLEGVLETVIHEMAHYANYVKNITDCNANQYHNKHFKKRAESFGLTVTKVRNRGYAQTSLNEQGMKLVAGFLKTKEGKAFEKLHDKGVVRSSDGGSVVNKYKKRFVAVDIDLAKMVEEKGGKLSVVTRQLLQDYANSNS